MQIQKKTCKNRASQLKIGPSNFDKALVHIYIYIFKTFEIRNFLPYCSSMCYLLDCNSHGLRTPGEEIAFTARPKIKFKSQMFRHGRSKFRLPDRPKFSGFFDLFLNWVSVVRGNSTSGSLKLPTWLKTP